MEITGLIHAIEPTKTVGDNFKIRNLIVEYADNPQYPEFLSFQFIKDKCDVLDKYKIGDEVKISFNLKGREWINAKGEKVYFNTLQAWKIDKIKEGEEKHDQQEKYAAQIDISAEPGEEDDLPF